MLQSIHWPCSDSKAAQPAFLRICRRNDGFALPGSGQELTAGGAAGKRLIGADSRILELLGKAQALHGAVCGNALALRPVAQAAVGLFSTGNSDVVDGVFHGVAPMRATPR